MRTVATFALCAFAGVAGAVSAPRLITWGLDPYAQTTENVVAAIARVTPQSDGGLVIDVGFDMEPSRAPTMQFVFSSSRGRSVSVLCEEGACTFPTQTMEVEGRWTYGYTIPAPTYNGKAIAPGRIAVMKRCRFGGTGGRRFEGGGYMVVEDEGVYVGRSGAWTIGGVERTFSGGVLLDPANILLDPAAGIMTLELPLPLDDLPNTPTCIRGKQLSFPVHLKAKETTP